MDDLINKEHDASIDKEYDYNLLLHVDSEDAGPLDMALGNAHHFIEALPGVTLRVVIVVTGPAVRLLTERDSDQARKAENLLEKGISIQACRHAMQIYKVNENEMWPNIEFVRSGVVALVQLQDEGMAYVKP
ncbi:DsrE family protein [Oxalobacter paraformigenes]|uniref:DsrE family protein n=1 Tax=Oxalobacter paraformigenes TaxID=556268 RepID=C3X4U5_9BURK|nr:DsrE family protein [Oxalobacter paraformigenes]EEO28231.1 hypothetical protein OFAG_01384 [Oxalobacter paraformigenes]